MKPGHYISRERSRVSLCGPQTVECGGQVFQPDESVAYVEFRLAHAFPVVTIDNTALHPQVVANSYRSMFSKVFDLAHLLKAYDPKANPHDRVLGTVMAVEFPDFGVRSAECGVEGPWKVQPDRAKAPGIRAVACMHKNVEFVRGVLEKYFTGQLDWTVSMENLYRMANSGFLIKRNGVMERWSDEWRDRTPEDLAALGWVYIPASEAPKDLLDCLDPEDTENTKVKRWRGRETVALFGGLDGTVHFQGVGLTPVGKEKEAEVSQMLAAPKLVEVNGQMMPDVAGLLRRTIGVME